MTDSGRPYPFGTNGRTDRWCVRHGGLGNAFNSLSPCPDSSGSLGYPCRIRPPRRVFDVYLRLSVSQVRGAFLRGGKRDACATLRRAIRAVSAFICVYLCPKSVGRSSGAASETLALLSVGPSVPYPRSSAFIRVPCLLAIQSGVTATALQDSLPPRHGASLT